MTSRRILIVLSSCDRIPGTDRRTGTWLEELAAPYYVFRDAGAQVDVASVAGGRAPLDPTSEAQAFQTDATRRFAADPEAQRALTDTLKLAAIRPEVYDAVFYSGGLGPVFDLSEDRTSVALIEAMHRAGKPIAAVCHGSAVFRNARDSKGMALVMGRGVTGFSNSEEIAANGPGVVPFLIEDELRRLGGRYSSAADGQPHVVTDGTLITGQNPASSEGAARKILEMIRYPTGGA
ncbi:MAG: type 1 glutamine amidotransferase domain-containing protein [Steroidobacteraceae bacterium]